MTSPTLGQGGVGRARVHGAGLRPRPRWLDRPAAVVWSEATLAWFWSWSRVAVVLGAWPAAAGPGSAEPGPGRPSGCPSCTPASMPPTRRSPGPGWPGLRSRWTAAAPTPLWAAAIAWLSAVDASDSACSSADRLCLVLGHGLLVLGDLLGARPRRSGDGVGTLVADGAALLHRRGEGGPHHRRSGQPNRCHPTTSRAVVVAAGGRHGHHAGHRPPDQGAGDSSDRRHPSSRELSHRHRPGCRR